MSGGTIVSFGIAGMISLAAAVAVYYALPLGHVRLRATPNVVVSASSSKSGVDVDVALYDIVVPASGFDSCLWPRDRGGYIWRDGNALNIDACIGRQVWANVPTGALPTAAAAAMMSLCVACLWARRARRRAEGGQPSRVAWRARRAGMVTFTATQLWCLLALVCLWRGSFSSQAGIYGRLRGAFGCIVLNRGTLEVTWFTPHAESLLRVELPQRLRRSGPNPDIVTIELSKSQMGPAHFVTYGLAADWTGILGTDPRVFPGRAEGWGASGPIWPLFLAGAVIEIRLVFLLLKRCRPMGRCGNCGYDLRATPDRCPECGTKCSTMRSPVTLEAEKVENSKGVRSHS